MDVTMIALGGFASYEFFEVTNGEQVGVVKYSRLNNKWYAYSDSECQLVDEDEVIRTFTILREKMISESPKRVEGVFEVKEHSPNTVRFGSLKHLFINESELKKLLKDFQPDTKVKVIIQEVQE